MSMQDILSDFVARVNNSVMVNKPSVVVIKSKVVSSVCNKLTKLSYFNGYEEGDRNITVSINLDKLNKIKRMSKPGQRQYVSSQKTPRILGGVGYNIISTSAGIKTHVEAKKENHGGEILFQVY